MALALVLLVLAGGGFAAVRLIAANSEGDNSTAAVGAEPAGSDATSPTLPSTEFARPTVLSAEWEFPFKRLGIDPTQGLVAQAGKTAFVADFSRRIARLDISVEGTVLRTLIGTDGYGFEPSATFGGPWTRTAHPGADDDRPIWDSTTLAMYQDLVTAEVRAKAQHVTTASALAEGQMMTTYTFNVDVRTLLPKIDDQFRVVGDDSALFSAVVEVTIDEAGLVRHWHYTLDDTLWREALVAAGEGVIATEGGTIIISLNQPVDVSLPTDYVDGPPAESTDPVPAANECSSAERTLETAVQAWKLDNPNAGDPTEAQLVGAYLRIEIETYDIREGAIVPTEGGPCA